jgi:hypothetical protein
MTRPGSAEQLWHADGEHLYSTPSAAGAKTPFLSHFYVEPIILPRQARDKHRKS